MRVTAEIIEIVEPSAKTRHFKELVMREANNGEMKVQVSESVYNLMQRLGADRVGSIMENAEMKCHISKSKNGTMFNNIHLISF